MTGRGGARVRSGPAPDPNALRRDRPSDQAGWTLLPAAGRDGDPPEWPLSRATKRELDVWASEWRRPQAVVWERDGLTREVAKYVRRSVQDEKPRSSVALGLLVMRQMDSLGITEAGMAKNRWRIEGQAAPAAATMSRVRSSGPSAKERLEAAGLGVVDGAA